MAVFLPKEGEQKQLRIAAKAQQEVTTAHKRGHKHIHGQETQQPQEVTQDLPQEQQPLLRVL